MRKKPFRRASTTSPSSSIFCSFSLIWPSSVPRGATVAASPKHERHGSILERRRRDDEPVEELVVPEDMRDGVRPAPRVHDRAERVEQPARPEQDESAEPGALVDLGDRGDADPPEPDRDHDREPPRPVHPRDADDDRSQAAAPDDRE